MKTKCYCVHCPKHPLFKKRHKIDFPTGYQPDHWILRGDDNAGVEVDCLEPASNAFDAFDIDPDFEEFPITAYGDGQSMTGFQRDGITLYAVCKAEAYGE